MKKVTLYIESGGESKTVALEDELSIGRTNLSRIVLGDAGLSRLNTTFFRDGDTVFVVDEKSLNGTFLEGAPITGSPKRVFDGDKITIGSETSIRVEITEDSKFRIHEQSKAENQKTKTEALKPNPQPAADNLKSKIENPKSNPSYILIAAVGLTFLIIFFAVIGLIIASRYDGGAGSAKPKPNQRIIASAAIPIRVVDPLVREEPDSLDELIEAWEVQEAELDAKDLQAVTVSTDAPQLAVTVAEWQKQLAKAMEARSSAAGLVSGVLVPEEMGGGRGIGKQLAKIKELGLNINNLPRDFSSLAQKRMNKELIELPLATATYVIDVGGSANDSPFNQFDPVSREKTPLVPGMEGYAPLAKLAANFDGQKYDLNNPNDRKTMKRRLLRMFHPAAKAVLEDIAGAYHKKFNRPLRVTSLTRSLEYQFDLTRITNNAFRGATPPHTTGCTFDMAYIRMTVEEQNFVMAKIADLEKRGLLDGLREVGQTPCYHIFVYPDGKPPKS